MEEEVEWGLTDPLMRLRRYMEKKGIWNIDVEKLTEEYKHQITGQFHEAEQNKGYHHNDVFDHMFTDMPDDLRRQKGEYEEFLSWKEKRR